jgi:hypothetical protein
MATIPSVSELFERAEADLFLLDPYHYKALLRSVNRKPTLATRSSADDRRPRVGRPYLSLVPKAADLD